MNWKRRGLLAMLVVASVACAAGTGGREQAPTKDRNLITAEEIARERAETAYEIVQRLHPLWLQKRGTNTSRPGDEFVVVYLDNAKMGGPEALQNIEALTITSIRFYDARAAQFKFGVGHMHGAIVVSTKDGP